MFISNFITFLYIILAGLLASLGLVLVFYLQEDKEKK